MDIIKDRLKLIGNTLINNISVTHLIAPAITAVVLGRRKNDRFGKILMLLTCMIGVEKGRRSEIGKRIGRMGRGKGIFWMIWCFWVIGKYGRRR